MYGARFWTVGGSAMARAASARNGRAGVSLSIAEIIFREDFQNPLAFDCNPFSGMRLGAQARLFPTASTTSIGPSKPGKSLPFATGGCTKIPKNGRFWWVCRCLTEPVPFILKGLLFARTTSLHTLLQLGDM